MTINLRRITQNDALSYQIIRLEALKNHPEAFASSYEEEIMYPLEHYRDRLMNLNTYCVGAFMDDVLVGMAVFIPQTREKIRHMADIFSVYVSPNHRQRGIGQRLIQHIIEYAKQISCIEQIKLSVTASNHEAIKLYQRCGFEIYGTDPKVIHIGNTYYDSILMIKYIK